MLEIIPAIMPSSLKDIEEKAGLVYRNVKTVHVDVMDGSITPSVNWPFTTEGLEELKKITTGEQSLPFWKEINYEVDVMTESPEDSIAEWVNAGFHRVIMHVENAKNLSSIIKEWKGVVELGVAIGVETPNDDVYPLIDKGIDFIQFMGIYQIGFQGNPFDVRVLEKIKKAREVYPKIPISVDGSVNLETAPKIIGAGADRLVIGSAIFNKAGAAAAGAIDITTMNAFDIADIGEIGDSDIFSSGKDKGVEQAIFEFKKLGA
jgi:ribulose-phosphate 3-epimerase